MILRRLEGCHRTQVTRMETLDSVTGVAEKPGPVRGRPGETEAIEI